MGGLAKFNDDSLADWLSWQESLHSQVIDLELSRVDNVYRSLFPDGVPFKVITVAGTNGKGSTIAFIDNIYQQSDYVVGKFTSPHITKYNERFAIDGINVSDQDICKAFSQIESYRGSISLTYFEFSTLAALVIFTNHNVEIALLEVGLGGRLDSVNIVNPDVSVITNISIDHVDYLGDTRELIGFEKAGIMRPNVTCICGDSNPPESIAKHAKSIGSQVIYVDSPYVGEINIPGEYQRINAAVAIKAIEQLQNNKPVTKIQVSEGVRNASLNGRYQQITINNKSLILDVAHNEAAIAVLAEELRKENTPTIAIFSALKDKNISAMVNQISKIIGKWILVPLDTDRAIPITELENTFSPSDNVTVSNNMELAINQAINSNSYKRIVIFGSFHTVTDAAKVLNI